MDPDEPHTEFRPGRSERFRAEPGYIAPVDTTAAYAIGAEIGKGGMGEVLTAFDRRIGRHVALKRLAAPAPTDADVQRFFREARIQARLDHPAVVPVYELGCDAQGRPYFTMKQLMGETLRDQLASELPSSQRLLRAFAEVCLAVEFAHSRGVVHRDLKPSNIMLGDYGEVYILDWGLARVFNEGENVVEKPVDIPSLDGKAELSQLLGTPGYIAPEQLHATGEVGRPVDIYALGSILFELLTRMPLHPRQSQAAIQSTLSTTGTLSPALRYPALPIAPELDVLCAQALAMDAATRPTARELADRVQAFLDGDRDLARRKVVAATQLEDARTALAEDRRAEAMRAAGRAIAIDPELTDAAQMVTGLMLEPPTHPPPELQAALRAAEAAGIRHHALSSMVAYITVASFFPIAIWNGIRKWPEVLAVFFVAMTLAAFAIAIRRSPLRSNGMMFAYALCNGLLCALIGRMAGPFIFVPALICVIMMSCMAYPAFNNRPWVLITVMVVAFVAPLLLEAWHVIPSTWEIGDGRLTSHAEALVIGSRTLIMVVGACLAIFVVSGIHAALIARANRLAQRQLVTQAWYLRQLLPHT